MLARRMVAGCGRWLLDPRSEARSQAEDGAREAAETGGQEAGQIVSSLELGLAGHTIVDSFRYLKSEK